MKRLERCNYSVSDDGDGDDDDDLSAVEHRR